MKQIRRKKLDKNSKWIVVKGNLDRHNITTVTRWWIKSLKENGRKLRKLEAVPQNLPSAIINGNITKRLKDVS